MSNPLSIRFSQNKSWVYTEYWLDPLGPLEGEPGPTALSLRPDFHGRSHGTRIHGYLGNKFDACVN